MSAIQKRMLALAATFLLSLAAIANPVPPDASYRPLPTLPFDAVKANDEARKAAGDAATAGLAQPALRSCPNRPIAGVMMSGGRKPVQGGVRVKLPAGVTWDSLAQHEPRRDPRARTASAGLHAAAACQAGDRRPGLSRTIEIDEIRTPGRPRPAALRRRFRSSRITSRRNFPPPIFLTTHPELGDVSRGKLLTIKNYYELMIGILTPVQIEGLAPAAHAVPAGGVQSDRGSQESRDQSLGVTCLDCHANFHTNAAFHLTPGRPARRRALPARYDQPARPVQPADPRLEALAALGRGFHRVRAAHRLFQRRPRQRDAQGREPARPARTRSR